MYYRLDRTDRIVEVHADWDDFSQANGGGHRSRSTTVLGRPLLDFVAGDAPRMFVRAALQAARLLGERRTLPYRCDSPTHRRHFEMAVSAQADGTVLVEHVLLREEARPLRLAISLDRSQAIRCSQCLSLWQQAEGSWLKADEAPADVPALAVCPTCADRLATLSPRMLERTGGR